MRNSKATGGIVTTFLLDKNRDHAQVLVETTGSTIVTYAYGHDLISQTRSGIGTRFYQYDGQLSTRQLTDTIGTVTDTYNYDAFGVLLAAVGATPNLYLYTGQQLDPNVGFIIYEPGTMPRHKDDSSRRIQRTVLYSIRLLSIDTFMQTGIR